MADAKQIRNAEKVFDLICKVLDKNKWDYDVDKSKDESLNIYLKVQGEDLPIELSFFVHPDSDTVNFLSRLPFDVPEEKRIDTSIAVADLNSSVGEGHFDFDVFKGHLYFRQYYIYLDGDIDASSIERMIRCAVVVVDEYNDKFFLLAKDRIDLKTFMEKR